MLSAEIERYLAELVARLGDELGDRLVGAWLFGSGALGDLDPATSDLDVQVVTTVRLPRAQRERLAARVSTPSSRARCEASSWSYMRATTWETRSAQRSR